MSLRTMKPRTLVRGGHSRESGNPEHARATAIGMNFFRQNANCLLLIPG